MRDGRCWPRAFAASPMAATCGCISRRCARASPPCALPAERLPSRYYRGVKWRLEQSGRGRGRWCRRRNGLGWHEEEFAHPTAEAGQHILREQVLIALYDLWSALGAIDRDVAHLRVNQPDESDTIAQIVADLVHDAPDAVTWRHHLDGQTRRHLAILGVQFLETPCVLVESDIGSAHCIRVALEDHTGVVAGHVAEATLTDVAFQQETDSDADAAMDLGPCRQLNQLDHLAPHEFKPAVGVLGTLDPLGELLGRHPGGRCDRAHRELRGSRTNGRLAASFLHDEAGSSLRQKMLFPLRHFQNVRRVAVAAAGAAARAGADRH